MREATLALELISRMKSAMSSNSFLCLHLADTLLTFISVCFVFTGDIYYIYL